jgi:hypothetical protein
MCVGLALLWVCAGLASCGSISSHEGRGGPSLPPTPTQPPTPTATPSSSQGGAASFAAAASSICARTGARLPAIAQTPGGPSRHRVELIKAQFLELAHALGRLSPPTALTARFQDYLHLLRTEAAQMNQLGMDLEHHDTASAQRDVNFDYGLANATNEVARSLGLVGC